MNLEEMAAETVRLLRQRYPDADCTLDFMKPWHLLVAAILSAQCTDARVNQITPALFARYPELTDLAAADQREIEDLIRSCGLYRNKARSIKSASQMLVDSFSGELPRTREELISLPGVGRKIANLILGDCYGMPAIVVDTHCSRISKLIGLTSQSDPLAVEKDLVKVVPEQDWITYGHLMVSHGRAACVARRPNCPACPLKHFCNYARSGGSQ